MSSSLRTGSPDSAPPAPARGLRWWLLFLTAVTVVVFGLVLLFGWAVNLDTMYDLSPGKDPLVRQDAIEKRIVFWLGITIFGLFLAAGVIGGWRARARQKKQPGFPPESPGGRSDPRLYCIVRRGRRPRIHVLSARSNALAPLILLKRSFRTFSPNGAHHAH